jgi:REP element-mobilizing transposase RayT
MDRYWLLTWTTYGTWLPGDERGFVSEVNDGCGGRVIHNVPGTPYDAGWELLKHDSQNRLLCPPIYLSAEHVHPLCDQFQETATYRGWQLIAVAIMRNHIHVEVGVPGDPNPDHILRDLKSYASRSLNRRLARPASGTWWTESGSKRKLKDEKAILGAAAYIRDQEHPLLVWIHSDFTNEIGSGVASGKQK